MKKHKLLREDILPAMASNRKVQRLLNEFMDLLSEYETIEPKSQEKDCARSVPNPPTDKMDSDTPMAEKLIPEAPSAAQPSSDEPAAEQNETSLQNTDQINFMPQVRDQMDIDSEKEKTETEQAECIPTTTTTTTTNDMNLDLPSSENLNPAPTSEATKEGS